MDEAEQRYTCHLHYGEPLLASADD